MTLLQHDITDFTADAYQNNEIKQVRKDDLLGH